MYSVITSTLPSVECLWRIQGLTLTDHRSGLWIDPARETWGLAFTKRVDATMRAELIGPSHHHHVQEGGEPGNVYWGADLHPHFKLRGIDKSSLTGKFVQLPVAGEYFFLGEDAFKIPTFPELEEFLAELERRKVIVDAAGDLLQQPDVTRRSHQRRHRETLGLSRRQSQQIRRAERAAALLLQGQRPIDVATETGYADQAHMTRTLKHLLGRTPRQLQKQV